MLETFVATRSGFRAETEATLERFTGIFDGEVANASKRHEDLSQLLATQAADLNAMRSEVAKVRASDERTTARLVQIETLISEFGRKLRIAVVTLGVLLVICIGLLVTMLLNKGI